MLAQYTRPEGGRKGLVAHGARRRDGPPCSGTPGTQFTLDFPRGFEQVGQRERRRAGPA